MKNYGKIIFHDSAGDGSLRLKDGKILNFFQDSKVKFKAGEYVTFELYTNSYSTVPFNVCEIDAETMIYHYYCENGYPDGGVWDYLENNGDDLEQHIKESLFNDTEIEWEDV